MGRSQDAVRLLRNGVPGRNGIAFGELKEGQLWINMLVVLRSLKDFTWKEDWSSLGRSPRG